MLKERLSSWRSGTSACLLTAFMICMSAGSMIFAQENVTQKLPASTWKELDVRGQEGVVAFSIDHDGNVEVFTSENFQGDIGPYDMGEVTMVTIAVTIGGAATRVCWTTNSGQEQCEPPQ